MKRITSILFLLFIFVSSAHAYKNMSNISARANNLNMTVENYTFTMALTGMLSGTMLGLFLWKTK